MKSYDEYGETAADEPPFSNGPDWECWQFSVCLGGGVDAHRCVNDTLDEDDGDDTGCPLIVLGVCGQMTPREWTDGGRVVYRCTEKTTAAEVSS